MTPAGAALGIDAVAALPGTTGAAMAWRADGRLHVTVIAKATFAFVPEAPMRRVEPQEIVRAEIHHDHNPARSVRLTTDLVPALGRAEVIFNGSAYTHGGPALSRTVRLAVFDGQRPLLDKRLLVRDRAGFERMPLVYERAAAGIDAQENPAAAFGVEPAIVDPAHPERPSGLGPISRSWPARRRLLGATPRKALDGPIAEIPAGFDWSYFQAAPADQRVDLLRGDEWIVLEGLHPTAPILRTRLPEVRAQAWIHGLTAFGVPKGQPLGLRLDTLRIDGDEQRCTVVWRQSFPVAAEAALAALRVVVQTALAGEPIQGPPPEPPLPRRVAAIPVEQPAAAIPASTVVLGEAGATLALPSDQAPAGPGLPFQRGAQGSVSRAERPWPPPPRAPEATLALIGEEVPVGPALPFEDPIEAPTERLRLPIAESPEEGPGATLRLDADEVAAAVRARLAPFPLATPGEAPAAPAAPIPGAPWAQPADEAPALPEPADDALGEDLEATIPFRADPSSPWALGGGVSGGVPAASPPRTVGELAVVARGLDALAGTAAPPVHVPPPAPIPEPTPPEPPVLQAATAAAPPARSREGVIAALAAREPLSGRDLSGLDLSGLDFTGRVLDGANLRTASLIRAVFASASLVGANLQRAAGEGADLRDADLRGADLQKASFCGASFKGASLRDVLASKADLAGARFDHADLRGASLRGAILRTASFEDAKLDGADLRNADLEGAVGSGLPTRS